MTKHESNVVEQNTTKRPGVGLRAFNPERASPGFTLFSPLIWGDGRVYLVDLRGDVVHWEYVNPFFGRPFFAGAQGTQGNLVFRALRYSAEEIARAKATAISNGGLR